MLSPPPQPPPPSSLSIFLGTIIQDDVSINIVSDNAKLLHHDLHQTERQGQLHASAEVPTVARKTTKGPSIGTSSARWAANFAPSSSVMKSTSFTRTPPDTTTTAMKTGSPRMPKRSTSPQRRQERQILILKEPRDEKRKEGFVPLLPTLPKRSPTLPLKKSVGRRSRCANKLTNSTGCRVQHGRKKIFNQQQPSPFTVMSMLMHNPMLASSSSQIVPKMATDVTNMENMPPCCAGGLPISNHLEILSNLVDEAVVLVTE